MKKNKTDINVKTNYNNNSNSNSKNSKVINNNKNINNNINNNTDNNSNNNLSDEFMNMYWNFYSSNLSKRTQNEYFRVLLDFSKITQTDLLNTNYTAVEKYYNYIEDRLKNNRLSYNTAVMRFSVLRTVSEYIRFRKEKDGHSYINHFKEINHPDADKTLKEENLPDEKALNYILTRASVNNDDKAFLLFSLVIKCGLKTSEVCKLDVEFIAIDTNDNFCLSFPCKGKLSRIIKLPDDISSLINSYIDTHKIISGPIFLNRRKNRMKIRDAERLLNKYIDEGIKENVISDKFTLQAMRHAAFKYMLKGGASDDDVAGYCGITTKWMSRYKNVVSSSSELTACDYSIISIKQNTIMKNKEK